MTTRIREAAEEYFRTEVRSAYSCCESCGQDATNAESYYIRAYKAGAERMLAEVLKELRSERPGGIGGIPVQDVQLVCAARWLESRFKGE